MPDTPTFLADRLGQEAEKTQAFFKALQPEQWDLTVYTEGTRWKVRQVLMHFVSTEAAFNALIADIQCGGPGAPESFDINSFNESEVADLAGSDPEQLLEKYAALRQKLIRRVSALQPEDLEKQGRHPYLGEAPLHEIIKLVYRHNQIHLRDIRRLISM